MAAGKIQRLHISPFNSHRLHLLAVRRKIQFRHRTIHQDKLRHILIVAIGKPQFIDKEYVKDGAVVIDVGIHRDENNKLCGDVKYDEVEPVASYITPVPGGVGPMTIAMLMHNCVEAMKLYS